MCAQRQDYVLRLLEQLSRFLAEVIGLRRAGRPDEALMAVLQAQEKLFGRTIDAIVSLPAGDQVDLLCAHEQPPIARDKCLAHASLLHATGEIYADKNQPALAHGAWLLALHVLACLAERFPQRAEVATRLETLLKAETNASTGIVLGELLRELHAG